LTGEAEEQDLQTKDKREGAPVCARTLLLSSPFPPLVRSFVHSFAQRWRRARTPPNLNFVGSTDACRPASFLLCPWHAGTERVTERESVRRLQLTAHIPTHADSLSNRRTPIALSFVLSLHFCASICLCRGSGQDEAQPKGRKGRNRNRNGRKVLLSSRGTKRGEGGGHGGMRHGGRTDTVLLS